jgi:hypothetical protein
VSFSCSGKIADFCQHFVAVSIKQASNHTANLLDNKDLDHFGAVWSGDLA